jgi:nucleoside-diphosphate-sugar epimerase
MNKMDRLNNTYNPKSNKVLVTGANGFVGKPLCLALLEQGQTLRAAVRGANRPVENCETVAVGELNGQTDWTNALPGIKVVIHLAARVHVMNDTSTDALAEFRRVNVEGTLHLARQAVKVGVQRFIFISSIKVNVEHSDLDKPFTEADIANPQDAYGLSKYEAEQGLLLIAQQTGMEVVIIRPPLIYGPGVKANFKSILHFVKRGIPLPFGNINNKRSFVYLGNLISLIIRCIDHPKAVNQVFLVSDGEDLSTTQLLSECAKALGVKARLLPVPQKLIEFFANLLGKQDMAQRLCGNLQVDISKARHLLNWTPPVSVADGLIETCKHN